MLYEGVSRPRRVALLSVLGIMALMSLGVHPVNTSVFSPTFLISILFIKAPAWVFSSAISFSSWRWLEWPSFSISSPRLSSLVEFYISIDASGRQWDWDIIIAHTWGSSSSASNHLHLLLSSAWSISLWHSRPWWRTLSSRLYYCNYWFMYMWDFYDQGKEEIHIKVSYRSYLHFSLFIGSLGGGSLPSDRSLFDQHYAFNHHHYHQSIVKF